MINLFYAGIGSRKTPALILAAMTWLAGKLQEMGFTLRSGGAQGADTAFAQGCTKKEIFLAQHANAEATAIAAKYHPNWNACSGYAQMLHGRNSFQVLGKDLKSPSAFVVCWTPDGVTTHSKRTITTGGTGTAISIADNAGIKIFNLAKDTKEEVLAYAKGLITPKPEPIKPTHNEQKGDTMGFCPIVQSKIIDSLACYRKSEDRIYVGPDFVAFPVPERAAVLTHEKRHRWQYQQPDFQFDPINVAHCDRVEEIDADNIAYETHGKVYLSALARRGQQLALKGKHEEALMTAYRIKRLKGEVKPDRFEDYYDMMMKKLNIKPAHTKENGSFLKGKCKQVLDKSYKKGDMGMDDFKTQLNHNCGVAGIHCPCCNAYSGKDKAKLNHMARRQMKQQMIKDVDNAFKWDKDPSDNCSFTDIHPLPPQD